MRRREPNKSKGIPKGLAGRSIRRFDPQWSAEYLAKRGIDQTLEEYADTSSIEEWRRFNAAWRKWEARTSLSYPSKVNNEKLRMDNSDMRWVLKRALDEPISDELRESIKWILERK